MVLAVDIAGDRSADGDEPGAGGDRYEEAPGDDHSQQLVDADSGAHLHPTGRRVEHDLAGTRGESHNQTTTILRGVSVAATEAAGKRAGLSLKAITWQQASGFIGQLVMAFQAVLVVLVLIIFLVALVIISNALVMATLQRVQEIGTLRAVGAQRRFILTMLLIESLVVAAVFAALGIRKTSSSPRR